METAYNDLAAILAEDDARMNAIRRVYDPIAGDSSDPSREYFPVKELECHIPREMMREPLVRDLLHCGSLSRYLADIKGCVSDTLREAVLNEWTRLRCRYDFPFWCASFAYIKRKGGGDDTLFILNRPQRKLVATLEAMRRDGLPIRLVLLKARQWGGSTCVQLYMAWLQMIHVKGLNSLIIAHQSIGTDEIKDMFDRMLQHYPVSLLHDKSEEYSDSEKKMERVGSGRGTFRVIARNCKVKVGTAERPDSSRGGDYNLVHCSEVALWKTTRGKSPEDIVRSACSGVLLQPMTLIVYESTANGTGNFFQTEYDAAKRGESQFRSLFVAWYEIDTYSLPFASPAEREAFAASLLQGREAQQAVSTRQQPGAYLWWLWTRGATLEAIHWYVAERAKYPSHGSMASEYPSDDVEAFVHSGARVFDKYKVEALRDGCHMPFRRGEIVGKMPSGPESLANLRFVEDGQGALRMWEDCVRDPECRVSDRYLVVVDIGGRSEMADWSVIAVFDRHDPSGSNRPHIVAQWRGHTDFDLLAWNAARIASYYDEALLVIESNTLETADPERTGGDGQSNFLLNRLRDSYPNLYARRQSEEEVRQGAPARYGFHTNVATKPVVISMLVEAIRDGLYVERDEECLSEFLTYERRQNGSYGAIKGKHDDLLMTRAIGLHISFREMDPPRIMMRSRRPPRLRPASAAVF